MTSILKHSALALALALGSSTFALAHGFHDRPTPPKNPGNVAPEVDPGLAISAFSLLGGTLVVLRSRRRQTK